MPLRPDAGRRRAAPRPTTPTLAASWEALPVEELWLVGHRALRSVPRVAVLWDFLLEHLSRPEDAGQLVRPM